MALRELASCPAITCPATVSVADAARRMMEHDIGFLVVVDDRNHPIGVVTDRDLTLRVLASGKPPDLAVGEVRTRPPTSVNLQASALEAADLMERHLCRRLPLVDDDGGVVGVLSLDDLLSEAAEEVKRLSSVMREARRRKLLDLP